MPARAASTVPILVGSIGGTLCCLFAMIVVISVFVFRRAARIRSQTRAALAPRGFVEIGDGGIPWMAGSVDGRPVAVGSVVVDAGRRFRSRGRNVQRRTRLVTALEGPARGNFYCPAGYSEPSVEGGDVPHRAELIRAASVVAVAYWDPTRVRPSELPRQWLGRASGVIWFDVVGEETDADTLHALTRTLVALARRVDAPI